MTRTENLLFHVIKYYGTKLEFPLQNLTSPLTKHLLRVLSCFVVVCVEMLKEHIKMLNTDKNVLENGGCFLYLNVLILSENNFHSSSKRSTSLPSQGL